MLKEEREKLEKTLSEREEHEALAALDQDAERKEMRLLKKALVLREEEIQVGCLCAVWVEVA